MEFLAACANIAQIISVIWLIILGSKTIFEVMRSKRKRGTKASQRVISPMVVVNLFLTLVILVLSIALLTALHYVPSSSTTTRISPTLLAKSYGDLASPNLPLSIPCNINCVSTLNVELEGIVTRQDVDETIWIFNLSNQDTKICNLTVIDLRLEDFKGENHKGSGQILNNRTLSPGQSLKVDAIFTSTYVSLSPYILHMAFSCQALQPMIYRATIFNFTIAITIGVTTPTPSKPSILLIRGYAAILLSIVLLFFFIAEVISDLRKGRHINRPWLFINLFLSFVMIILSFTLVVVLHS